MQHLSKMINFRRLHCGDGKDGGPILAHLLPAVALLGLLLAVAGAPAMAQYSPAPGMALVPAGVFRPLFPATTETNAVQVKTFYLDVEPVTVGEYLEFVRANPRWQRSQIKKIFADEFYLKNWASDLTPGTNIPPNSPVTHVSWFAAKAFAQWKGKRLPTLAEWEHAAAASNDRPDGKDEAGFMQQVLEWYTTPNSPVQVVGRGQSNFYGVRDLHGLVWEWVLDFNTAMLTGDSRTDSGGLERGLFCGAGSQGGNNLADYPAFMRLGFRSSLQASYCVHNLGFRCAKDL